MIIDITMVITIVIIWGSIKWWSWLLMGYWWLWIIQSFNHPQWSSFFHNTAASSYILKALRFHDTTSGIRVKAGRWCHAFLHPNKSNQVWWWFPVIGCSPVTHLSMAIVSSIYFPKENLNNLYYTVVQTCCKSNLQ